MDKQEKLNALYYKLADEIFDYISYDDSLSIEMGKKFYKTIDAIINGTQKSIICSNFYADYIMCLNLMRINCDKIDWGTSIRFAWFNYEEEGYWSKEHYLEMMNIYNKIGELLK